MQKKKPIIALMYDFDRTLSPKDMQEFSFIPDLGIQDPDTFWDEADKLAKDHKMSGINAYMYLMLTKACEKDICMKYQNFVDLGKDVELFSGVDTWFERINNFAEKKGAIVEHYIISSGLKEIIQGTAIAHHFKEIFASSYVYDTDGIAVWPALCVDYTGKTQFLFRISKGILDINDSTVNDYMHDDEKRIPFHNMIYLGDGFSDIPCMKLVTENGGKSIVVYKPDTNMDTAKELINDNRADFMSSADYSKGTRLETLVHNIIDSMIASDKLYKAHDVSVKRASDKVEN
ncbi:MAG: haloacid dehalogenase-like hydrolase [Clostridiales bacterium]|nr:haloacid dehalogenase-like hydrolase [Clostridiales bacterium]